MAMRRLMCAFLVAAVMVAGCGDDDDDSATPTTAPSGSDEAATNEGADFEVMFDGEVCTVTGPDSVPAGSYTFVLTDTSELEGPDLYVDAYADGYTYADHAEFIEDAGGDGTTGLDRPDWAPQALRIFGAPTLELEENQTQKDYRLEAGPHGAVIKISGGGGIWGCAGFDVT